MPTSNWSRGPSDRAAGYADQNMRVSDAERQAVADRLAAHYAEGRLDQAEFDDRVGRAMGAKTRADLNGLFDDLPEPSGRGTGPAGAPGTSAAPHRKHGHPFVTAVLFTIVAVWVAVHVAWFAVSWVWLAVIALIVLAATGHLGHHHHR